MMSGVEKSQARLTDGTNEQTTSILGKADGKTDVVMLWMILLMRVITQVAGKGMKPHRREGLHEWLETKTLAEEALY